MGRDIEFIKALKKCTMGELSNYFIQALQNNGVNSGIIDRLMVFNKKYDFLYELYKILDEATDSGIYQKDRQKTIIEFGQNINFEFNFENDEKMVLDIFNNFKDYNEVCSIDV